MKLFLWLLQIVAEMVRNLVWLGVFHMVVVVSVIQDVTVVTCKKEDGRETIVDQ